MTVQTLDKQVLQVAFLQILTIKAQYSLMSAVRGPDAQYTVGMGPLKVALTQRFRAILFGVPAEQWGRDRIPGNCACGPMTPDVWNSMVNTLKTVQGPGTYHFLAHIVHAMEHDAVRDHPIWDGKGGEIMRLVVKSKDRIYIDADPKLKEEKTMRFAAEDKARMDRLNLKEIQHAVRDQRIATENLTKLVEAG